MHGPEKFDSFNPVDRYKAVWQSVSAFDLGQSLTTWSVCCDFVCLAIIISGLCWSCIARKQLKCNQQNQNEGDFLLLLGSWSIYAFPNSFYQVQQKPLHYIQNKQDDSGKWKEENRPARDLRPNKGQGAAFSGFSFSLLYPVPGVEEAGLLEITVIATISLTPHLHLAPPRKPALLSQMTRQGEV